MPVSPVQTGIGIDLEKTRPVASLAFGAPIFHSEGRNSQFHINIQNQQCQLPLIHWIEGKKRFYTCKMLARSQVATRVHIILRFF